ncbi:MAG: hypothetical protein IPI67_12855 [Myxococcales bacterium]|nr:hypothetical protein [Myxococcales bacterium]
MADANTGTLDDAAELLFRQVNPGFIRDGRVGSQAFRPTPKDHRKLSVARSALTTAEDAFQLHTECKKFRSAGTWAVTVGECSSLGLPALADPLSEQPCPDPAHAVVDFATLTNSKVEAHGARLARFANERGRLHPPDELPAG